MKLKYIFGSLLSAFLFAGCADDGDTVGTYNNLTYDDTYVTISADGGDATVTLKTNADWKFDDIFSVTATINGEKTTLSYPLPVKLNSDKTAGEYAWLTVDKLSGTAGETTLTFHADATDGGRETELRLSVGDKKQFIRVRQGSMEATPSTCAEIIAGPDSKTYQVTGTVMSIANTTYGNWYLADETGQIYIYGTLDANGATKNFTSLGIEVGDVVTVEGPKTTYNGTVELVDVTVIKIVKSLVKVVTPDATIEKEGGEFSVKVAYKGSGANFTIPAEAQSWLHPTGSTYKAGVKTIYDTAEPADTTIFTFQVDANEGEKREAAIDFSSSNSSSSSTVTFNVKQAAGSTGGGTQGKTGVDGSTIVSIAAFNAAEVNADVYYQLTGTVTNLKDGDQYGNFDLVDETGSVYVYGVLSEKGGEKKKFQELVAAHGIKEGSKITIVGTRGVYNDKIEVLNAYFVCMGEPGNGGGSTVGADGSTIISVSDFNAAAESNDVWYQLTGTISNLKDGDLYGNFDLTDATGSVYVYGVLSEKGGEKKKFQELVTAHGIANGSTITIVGTRGSYKDKIEVTNAYFISVK